MNTLNWPDNFNVMLIGVGKYKYEKWNIPNIESNINKLLGLFNNPKYSRIPSNQINVIKNNSNQFYDVLYLKQALINFADSLTQDDCAIIYYSGHGVQIYDRFIGELTTMLTTPMTNENNIEIQGLPIEQLDRIISTSKAKVKIIIIDCCYSGRLLSKKLTPNMDEVIVNDISGNVIITSSSANSVSLYPDSPLEPTSFTGTFIDVIENGIEKQVPFLTLEIILELLNSKLRINKLPNHQSLIFENAHKLPLFYNVKFKKEQKVKKTQESRKEIIFEQKLKPKNEFIEIKYFEPEGSTIKITVKEGIDSILNNDLPKCSQFIEKTKNYIGTDERLYNLIGLANLQVKVYDVAVENFNKALSYNHNFIDAINNRGICFREIGKFQKSINDFQKTTELYDQFYKGYLNIGVCKKLLHDYMTNYNSYLKPFPFSIEDSCEFYDLKNYSGAISAYEQAIDIKPDCGFAYYLLAEVYFDLYNMGKAYNYCLIALKLKYFDAIELLEKIEKEKTKHNIL